MEELEGNWSVVSTKRISRQNWRLTRRKRDNRRFYIYIWFNYLHATRNQTIRNHWSHTTRSSVQSDLSSPNSDDPDDSSLIPSHLSLQMKGFIIFDVKITRLPITFAVRFWVRLHYWDQAILEEAQNQVEDYLLLDSYRTWWRKQNHWTRSITKTNIYWTNEFPSETPISSRITWKCSEKIARKHSTTAVIRENFQRLPIRIRGCCTSWSKKISKSFDIATHKASECFSSSTMLRHRSKTADMFHKVYWPTGSKMDTQHVMKLILDHKSNGKGNETNCQDVDFVAFDLVTINIHHKLTFYRSNDTVWSFCRVKTTDLKQWMCCSYKNT